MKISIITTTFNSAATIQSCLNSIAEQSFSNIDHIIIDGASSDDTVKIIKSYQENHPERTINLLSEPDNGIYDALNKGIALATGDIVGFVHSDDLLASQHVLDDIAKTFKSKNCDGVFGDLIYVNRKNTDKTIRNWTSCDFNISLLKKGWMPAHPTLYVKKDVYQRFGDFNTQYKIAADYEFILRIFKNESLQFCYLPKVIVKMRVGGESNKSVSKVLLKMKEDYKAIRYHKTGNLLTLIQKSTSKLKQFF